MSSFAKFIYKLNEEQVETLKIKRVKDIELSFTLCPSPIKPNTSI